MSKLDIMWAMITQNIEDINKRVAFLEAKETAQTFDEVTQLTFEEAQASDPPGIAFRYITNGLREGGGTGVLAYFDGTTWRRVSDNAAVST